VVVDAVFALMHTRPRRAMISDDLTEPSIEVSR